MKRLISDKNGNFMTERFRETSLNLDEMLDHIVARMREVVPFDSGGIVVYSADGQWLVPRRFVIAGVEMPVPRLLHTGEGLVGQVAAQRQPQRIDDNSAADFMPYDEATRSMLAVPMLLNGELFGVMNVESRQLAIYTPLHQAVLSALADQAALALYTCCVAAVDQQVGPGHERGIVACQEQGSLGDLFGPSEPAQWVA